MCHPRWVGLHVQHLNSQGIALNENKTKKFLNQEAKNVSEKKNSLFLGLSHCWVAAVPTWQIRQFFKKSLWLHYGYIVFFSVEEWDCRNCLEMFHLIKSVLPGILCTFTTRGHHKFKWRWTSFTVTWICFYAYFIVFIADSPYQYAAHFNNNGYIALPKSIFPRR